MGGGAAMLFDISKHLLLVWLEYHQHVTWVIEPKYWSYIVLLVFQCLEKGVHLWFLARINMSTRF
jgi:hypothetical protein